jgi:hypothetical protein
MRARTRNSRSKAVAAAPRSKNSGPKSRAKSEGISVEFLYLTDNAKALEAYPGEMLLIQGYQLLAHSSDYQEIERIIQQKKIDCPFIYRVPRPEEINFV